MLPELPRGKAAAAPDDQRDGGQELGALLLPELDERRFVLRDARAQREVSRGSDPDQPQVRVGWPPGYRSHFLCRQSSRIGKTCALGRRGFLTVHFSTFDRAPW